MPGEAWSDREIDLIVADYFCDRFWRRGGAGVIADALELT